MDISGNEGTLLIEKNVVMHYTTLAHSEAVWSIMWFTIWIVKPLASHR